METSRYISLHYHLRLTASYVHTGQDVTLARYMLCCNGNSGNVTEVAKGYEGKKD